MLPSRAVDAATPSRVRFSQVFVMIFSLGLGDMATTLRFAMSSLRSIPTPACFQCRIAVFRFVSCGGFPTQAAMLPRSRESGQSKSHGSRQIFKRETLDSPEQDDLRRVDTIPGRSRNEREGEQ